jgi:uncharacterized membrane protein YuzA (DUF378 family)
MEPFKEHSTESSKQSNVWMKTTVRMIAIAIVIIGGINWLLVAFGYNLVESLNRALSSLFKRRLSLDKVIYAIVGVCAIALAFDRTLWLPFLGESVLPSVLIPLSSNSTGAQKIQLKVAPNTKVAYWAAKPGSNPETPVVDAYGKYDNSGVVMSDAAGIATISFEKGTEYTVPSGRQLKSHVHYRELSGEYGMIGPVQTLYV